MRRFRPSDSAAARIDHRQRRLLRTRGKRPENRGSRSCTQACYEFTPFHFDSRCARSEKTKKIENYF
jgi:hypothetical protein